MNVDNTQRINQRHALRQAIQRRRNALTPLQSAEFSEAIAERVIPFLVNRQHIAGYLAIGREVTVSPLLERCRALGSTTYLPVVQSDSTLLFSPFDQNTSFTKNRFSIDEPIVDAQSTKQAMELDAMLVPLVGFDLSCNRMGMGGGYYDRSLAKNGDTDASPLLIGIAYDLQETDSVLPDWWDIAMHKIVTPSRVIERTS